ncbi:MAG: 50S ribosomal protein L25 [Patescibacteria group bacterium]
MFGKKTKQLRREGNVPAILERRGKESLPLVVDHDDFVRTYLDSGESSIASLQIPGETVDVLVTEVQQHPVTDEVMHVNFRRVEEGEKIAVTVPIEIVGESTAVRSSDLMLLHLLTDLELECFPQDIPSSIEVDVSNLEEADDAVTVGDLSLDFSKVDVVGHSSDDLVVKIEEAEMEEVEEVVEEIPVDEIEATAERAEEEGEEEEAPVEEEVEEPVTEEEETESAEIGAEAMKNQ